MIRHPAQYRDISIFSDSLPFSWDVPLTRNGIIEDLSASIITASLWDDGVDVGSLDVSLPRGAQGLVTLTLSQALYDATGTYTTWRLRESPIFGGVVIRGRLVKRV